MHILIEGFDGTGKSSLARTLELATGWPVVHQSPGPPRDALQLESRSRSAINAGLALPDLISDRWPLISDYCYSGEGSIVRIAASLKLGRVDRILFCDVDLPGELRIKARPGDEADRLQTIEAVARVGTTLGRYRLLMDQLMAQGFDVRRYKMQGISNG